MSEYIKKQIEIDKEVYKELIKYCEENEISINSFIKLNLECL